MATMDDRKARVIRGRLNGLAFRDIAENERISPARARALYKTGCRLLRYHEIDGPDGARLAALLAEWEKTRPASVPPFTLLLPRVAADLRKSGLDTPERIIEAWGGGVYLADYPAPATIGGVPVPGVGLRSLQIIAQWLGVPPPRRAAFPADPKLPSEQAIERARRVLKRAGYVVCKRGA